MNKLSKIILVAANIFPVFAVIFFKWSVYEVLFIYFSETFLFFYLNLAKFFYLPISLSKKITNFLIYSFVLSLFLLFEAGIIILYYFRDMEVLNPNMLPKEIILSLFSRSYFAGIIIFLFSHLYSFKVNFINKQNFENHTPQTLIKAPALRIWILFVVTLLGLFIEKHLNTVVVLILFMILKTGVDLLTSKDRVKVAEKDV